MAIAGFDANPILGPIELGVVIAAVLFGCAVVQMYVYYKKFPNDSWRIKGLVAFEMSLQIPHLVCLTAAMWTMTVTNYGEPQTLVTLPATSVTAVVLSAPITFAVQVYFIVRLYRLSQDRFLPAFCIILAFVRLVFNMTLGIAGYYMKNVTVYEHEWSWIITSILAVSISCDLTIAAALSYHLNARRKTGFKQTTRIIDQMIVYTIETGLATSLTDLIEGIFFWKMPNNYIWMGVYSFESGLYLNSLLAALNSRALLNQMRTSEGVVEFEFGARRSDTVTGSGGEGDQRRKSRHPIVISVTQEIERERSAQKELSRVATQEPPEQKISGL
ncbi:hypothetical protein HYDPIDRAFT_111536 [Hydnomerulius pinastri MD-312]|uniref:DUF6534 domain-containing protein n=1 Tax=Hydnomerulius pinastri MD-312 TaxID=994086 RepID=A0A0C9VGZ5_9AGAM|nr:hypothetical protein HYDPIDRAFT_111536 [Hydnomerulius pinastri MD-312]